ncbi:MAG: VOC family protein [Lachnospiraceae bacterium]|nr:VOC family protein [Lachnospiraceae bacterium]MDD7627381.1 VOC family protein [Lachnospiraceae bacterium]MDY4119493.1 VOC family protein [Lachnospiraceae bacterium]
MSWGSIYLVVKDFDKSLDFYEKVLDMKVSATNGKRFAMFNNPGLNLCLMNGYYDEQFPEQKETRGPSYDEYDNMSEIANSTNTKKVFINLGVEDLDKEYQRLLDLGIGMNMTPIRYINVFSPYWYFTFMDPDGNPIEITGGHKE